MLGLDGFGFETADDVKADALGDPATLAERLGNAAVAAPASTGAGGAAPRLERIANVPIYDADALVRRAPSLQATADARGAPRAGLPTALWQRLGLEAAGAHAAVHVQQGAVAVTLAADHDPSLAPTAVRVPAGHPATAALGAMFGEIAVEPAAAAAVPARGAVSPKVASTGNRPAA
jgi:NADH-quinone oxidoreductase subunit G